MNPTSKLVAAALAAGIGVMACGPDRDAPNNGVDDVRAACEIRTTWTRARSDKCINCMVGAKSPPCGCEEFKDFAGLCRSQEEARLAESSCTTPIKDCASKCATTDCGCLDGCYAAAEPCKRAVAATDGCVTDVCAQYCK